MEPAAHLSVIIDMSPIQWNLLTKSRNEHPLSFQSFLTQVLAFLNCHIACKHENTIAVFGALPGKSVPLYSSTEGSNGADQIVPDANFYRPFQMVDTIVSERIMEEMEKLGESEAEEPCQLVGALTKALCYSNRAMGSTSPAEATDATIPKPEHRILILSVSPDLSSSYIPLMNSIFSAQKLKITIDVCKVFGSDAVFLQQAAHLTGGSYLALERQDALLQYLVMTFLPNASMRRLLTVPTQDKIDFRAACFCHKQVVDIGYICSVCLSIFCQPVPVCSTCRTKFPIKTLQRLNASRSPLPAAQTAARTSMSRLSTSETRSTSVPNTLPSSNAIQASNGRTDNRRVSAAPRRDPTTSMQAGANGLSH